MKDLGIFGVGGLRVLWVSMPFEVEFFQFSDVLLKDWGPWGSVEI